MKVNQKPGKRLQALLDAGTVYLDNSTPAAHYVGKASDGQEVSIGDPMFCSQIEAYLADHPTPDSW